MRLFSSPSIPSTPCAPPNTSVSTGRSEGPMSRSPTSRLSDVQCRHDGGTGESGDEGGRQHGRAAQALRRARGDRGVVGARVEHQAVRSLAVDQHWRPDAPDPIAPCRRDIARLGRLDYHFVQLLGGSRQRLRRNGGGRGGWQVRRAGEAARMRVRVPGLRLMRRALSGRHPAGSGRSARRQSRFHSRPRPGVRSPVTSSQFPRHRSRRCLMRPC